jgi:hypothetical protein
MVDLKGVYTVTGQGPVYYYAWRGGAPRLRGEPGSPEFVARAPEARRAGRAATRRSSPGSAPCSARLTPGTGRGPKPISAKTKASWTTWLDRIQVEFGELAHRPVRPAPDAPQDHQVAQHLRRTPRAADMGVQVLSRLLSFGMAEGKLMNNICNAGTTASTTPTAPA